MRKTLKQIYEEHNGKMSDQWTLYLREWDRLFASYRDLQIQLLEIGVQNGGSLEIWAKYFLKAEKIVGCDIDPKCEQLRYDDARITVVVGDANSADCENKILQQTPTFDIIIDDGSHKSSDIVRSFAHYFPHLNDNGIYVVEDLHTSYWKNYEGGLHDPLSAMAFFKRLADVINYEHWRNNKSRRSFLTAFEKNLRTEFEEVELIKIHSIEFVNSLCIIKKLSSDRNNLGKRIIVGTDGCVTDEGKKLNGTLIQDFTKIIKDDANLDVFELIASINSITSTINEKEQAIQSLTAQAVEREQAIQSLTAQAVERELELRNIKISKVYRFSLILRKLRKKILPRNSRTESFLIKIYRKINKISGVRKSIDDSQKKNNIQDYSICIIICVHNALEDVIKCLESINRNTFVNYQLIIINDGSDYDCSNFLIEFTKKQNNVELIHNKTAKGYTKAANQGLRYSKSNFIILLNSDTIVTKGWLKKLISCAISDEKIGLVGPLSNAASWQSVPKLFNVDGDWSTNPLPNSWSIDDMGALIELISDRKYPRVPILNGFCILLKRDVINKIGYLDENNFLYGYGEENDFCLRALKAGFELAIADDVFIYHAKSKSYTNKRRHELSKISQRKLVEKYGELLVKNSVSFLRNNSTLSYIRNEVDKKLNLNFSEVKQQYKNYIEDIKLLFILPTAGPGGGTHSIVQEANAMYELGVNARIAIPKEYFNIINNIYNDSKNLDNLFIFYESIKDLINFSSQFNVVIGTVNYSIPIVKKIIEKNNHIIPAYYVQDYEPLFYDKGSKQWDIAYDSYTLIPNILLFGKTNWICEKVNQEHGVPVNKVSPSLDHSVFYPSFEKDFNENSRIKISAMIRPKTPRRGAHRTMQILKSIKSFFGNQIEIQIFGCSDSDIELFGLERDFLYKNFGVLRRRNVADVLRSSDIFLDLSDYQAFGRTALEAMACGCVVVITHNGGIYEYATHNENSVIVDVTNIEHCIDEISKIIKSPDLRKKLANNALLKAAEYSPIKAARSELEVISQKTRTMEKNNSHYLNKNNVRNIVLDDSVKILGILSRTETGYTGSAYIRLLLPLKHNTISKKLSFVPGRLDDLSVYKPQAVLVQRTAISNKEDAINLVNYCKNNRVKIIYETDDDLFEIASSGSSHPEAQKYSSWTLGAKVIATHADLITVSSTNLKQKMIGFNHKTEVLYNSLDENLWQINNTINRSRNSPNEQIGILYMGTNTHGEDFLLIEESLKKIHRKYKNQIRFDIIGVSNMKFDTSYLNPIYVPKGCTEYPNFVKWLYENSYRWEIGLAPLANTEFNRCKSFIKFLDYSALGLASICTKIEPYEIIIKDGINGILVENDVDSWFVAIDGLINDSVRRKTISRNAFSTLKTKHTLKTNSRIWLDTYFSLFNL